MNNAARFDIGLVISTFNIILPISVLYKNFRANDGSVTMLTSLFLSLDIYIISPSMQTLLFQQRSD